METDYGVIIGLISIVAGVGVLGMSYVGAFLLGQMRGRRDADRTLRADTRDEPRVGHADRLLVVESAVDAVARAIERLTDAQRIALLEQARISSLSEGRVRPPSGQPRNTPT
jgi:hypothetical protein